ncbi:MAG: hypothetical protein MPW15_27855 [Candidatus Manganitrophus sp.]|nr:hypothetical protein [Candidatus Manganitrophus sp.]
MSRIRRSEGGNLPCSGRTSSRSVDPFPREWGPPPSPTGIPFPRTFLGEEVDYVEREEPIDRASPACRQKRSVLFVKPDYSIVRDLFSGEGVVNIDWLHSFAPQARIEGNLAEGFHITTPDGRLWLVAFGTDMEGVEVRLHATEKQVVVRSAGPLPLFLTTLLYPDHASSLSRYDFKSLYFPSIEGGSAFEVLTATHTDTFLFAPARKRLALSNVRFEGEQLFVRRDYVGEIARLFALSGRFCYWEGKPFSRARSRSPSLNSLIAEKFCTFGEPSRDRSPFMPTGSKRCM